MIFVFKAQLKLFCFFLSKKNLDFLYQFYIYDEFVAELDDLNAGDYILLKNANLFKRKSPKEDLILRLPGAMGTKNKFGRCLKKLVSFTDFSNGLLTNMSNQFRSIIEFINKKGHELKFEFLSDAEYFGSVKNNSMMIDEIVHSMNTNLRVNNNEASNNSTKNEIFILNDQSTEVERIDLEELMFSDEAISKKNQSCDKENFHSKSSARKRTFGDIIKSYLIETTTETTMQNETFPITSIQVNIAETFVKFLANKTVQPKNVLSAELSEPFEETAQIKGLINEHFKDSKRFKIIDSQEISSDIFKLTKLTRYTYLVPYLTSSLADTEKFAKSVPWFNSLDYLHEEAEKHNFFKCKVKATLCNYSLNACPQIGLVFVACKKCDYINFTPFYVASKHRKSTFNNATNDLVKLGGDQGKTYFLENTLV